MLFTCCVFCFCCVIIFHMNLDFSCILISEGAKDLINLGAAIGKPAAFLLPPKKKEERSMMKITPKQAERIRRLVKSLCANCDESGSCLLLDDGEGHKCVQLISIYGIYCNYFLNAVLPAEKELYEEIQKQNKLKTERTNKNEKL